MAMELMKCCQCSQHPADCLCAPIGMEQPMTAATWTVSDYDVYAVLCRPDGTAAARFHVIAEAYMACAAINAAEEKEAGRGNKAGS